MGMARNYRYFSADSHFESLPETWTHRVPARYRDRAPRRIKLADGRDAIVEEGQPLEYRGTNLFAGSGRLFTFMPGVAAAAWVVQTTPLDATHATVRRRPSMTVTLG